MIHVELQTGMPLFCGRTHSDLTLGVDEVIQVDQWSGDPSLIQMVTCEDCLLRIFMIGDAASLALERMGRKVEIRIEGVDDAEQESSAEEFDERSCS